MNIEFEKDLLRTNIYLKGQISNFHIFKGLDFKFCFTIRKKTDLKKLLYELALKEFGLHKSMLKKQVCRDLSWPLQTQYIFCELAKMVRI